MKGFVRFTLVLASCVLMSCHIFKKEEDVQLEAVQTIQYKSGACFGSCPIFECTITTDGLSTFSGRNFVDFEGDFTADVAPEIVQEWVQKAEAFQFFGLDKEYDGPVSDLPKKVTTITVGDQSHSVISRYGTPKELKTWEKAFTNFVLKEIDWKEAPAK
ncbi:MAG: hypothetical protein ACI9YL_001260 [Luteibaculaceae bacterium]|jgi:hypothetical protein